VRQGFNPGGNRQLNTVPFTTVALTQIHTETEGRAYYLHKRAAGKTHREALRYLRRRLSDPVFATMRRPPFPPPETVAVGAEDARQTRINGLRARARQAHACSSLGEINSTHHAERYRRAKPGDNRSSGALDYIEAHWRRRHLGSAVRPRF